MNTAREDKALADALIRLVELGTLLSDMGEYYEGNAAAFKAVKALYEEAAAEYGAAVRDMARCAKQEDDYYREDY